MANTSKVNACRYLDSQMVRPMRLAAVARNLFQSVVTLPPGKTSVDFDRINEMGAALMEYHIPTGEIGMDEITLTPTVLRVPNIFKGYKLERHMVDAYNSAGKAIAIEAMLSAMFVVLAKEEAFLMNGWTPRGTKLLDGLYSGAGNDYSTTKDFATDGLPTDAVLGGLALNDADGVPPMNYNLLLNPTQFRELQANVSVTTSYNELNNILGILNPIAGAPKGTVTMDPRGNIVAGTGLLIPVDVTGAMFDLVVCEQPQNIMANEKWPGKGAIESMVFEALVPRIKQPNCLCKLSSI